MSINKSTLRSVTSIDLRAPRTLRGPGHSFFEGISLLVRPRRHHKVARDEVNYSTRERSREPSFACSEEPKRSRSDNVRRASILGWISSSFCISLSRRAKAVLLFIKLSSICIELIASLDNQVVLDGRNRFPALLMPPFMLRSFFLFASQMR